MHSIKTNKTSVIPTEHNNNLRMYVYTDVALKMDYKAPVNTVFHLHFEIAL